MLRNKRNGPQSKRPKKPGRIIAAAVVFAAAGSIIGLSSAQAMDTDPIPQVVSRTLDEVMPSPVNSEDGRSQSATTTAEEEPAVDRGSLATTTAASTSSTAFDGSKQAGEVRDVNTDRDQRMQARIETAGPAEIRVISARGISSATKPDTGRALQGGEVMDGIVTSNQNEFFLPGISIRLGGAAGFQLALANASDKQQIRQISVQGLPESILVKGISLEQDGKITAVPYEDDSVLVDLPANLEPEGFNVEIQLIAEGLIEPGEYEPTISITSPTG